MANKVLRLDVMSGNRDNTQVKSAKYFKNDAVAPVENGTIVAVGAFVEGEREIHKITDVEADSELVGIVSTPEVEYEERGYHGFETFTNKKDDVVRVHILHEGDCFSIANGTDKADMDCGAKLVAKHMGSEVVGRLTYEVFEVRAK